jgi:hypothetical protein
LLLDLVFTMSVDTGIPKAFADELAAHRAANGDALMRWTQKYWSLIVFFALVAVGLILHFFYQHDWPLYSTFHAFADALIVAGLLGATVDRFLKHDLMRDVGAIFIGWALPDEIRNYIREVSNTSLVRRNYRAEYVFTASEDDVVIDASEEWEVFNYSTGVRKYQPHMAINLVESPSRDHIQCDFTTNGRTKVYTAKKLDTEHREKEETRVIYRLPKSSLRAQDIEDRRTAASCRVKWQYRITKKRNDVILTYSTLPTIGITVLIRCNCGLKFEFDPEKAEHAENSSEWRYPGLFMPRQAFSIRWYPETTVSATNPVYLQGNASSCKETPAN